MAAPEKEASESFASALCAELAEAELRTQVLRPEVSKHSRLRPSSTPSAGGGSWSKQSSAGRGRQQRAPLAARGDHAELRTLEI